MCLSELMLCDVTEATDSYHCPLPQPDAGERPLQDAVGIAGAVSCSRLPRWSDVMQHVGGRVVAIISLFHIFKQTDISSDCR